MRQSQSIIALSTPRLISAIHIIRVSGDEALSFLKKLCCIDKIESRRVYTTSIRCPKTQKLIDHCLVFYFQSPHSYTGEDMVELQCHGSLSIVDEILEIAQREGLFLAQEGEFTQRAFLNGKLNIDQAQAVDALIRAKTTYLRENAMKILTQQSAFGFHELREDFKTIYSQVEAYIEFPEDDQDSISSDLKKTLKNTLQDIEYKLKSLVDQYKKAKHLEAGIHIGIVGCPNVGKSTLLNTLLSEDRSIISAQEGTTRDYIKERIIINSQILWLYDTAGIREGKDVIEKKGIEFSKKVISQCDFLILLLDERVEILDISHYFPREKIMTYINKKDKIQKDQRKVIENKIGVKEDAYISLLKESDQFEAREKIFQNVLKKIQKYYSIEESQLSLVNQMQMQHCQGILDRLPDISQQIEKNTEMGILSEELQDINQRLGLLDLSVGTEEILDQLFSQFCIGK